MNAKQTSDMLRFLTTGAEVKRYHTHSMLREETVGHHSHGVALICLLLRPDASAALLRAALLHDMAEQVTGDIPSPAKRMYGIDEQVHKRELEILAASHWGWPGMTDDEQHVLKLADLAQGALHCLREVEMGNRRFVEIFNRYACYYALKLHALGLGPDSRESLLLTAIKDLQHESER